MAGTPWEHVTWRRAGTGVACRNRLTRQAQTGTQSIGSGATTGLISLHRSHCMLKKLAFEIIELIVS